jgi:hypothetical protein
MLLCMQEYVSIRLEAGLAEALKARAERVGMSVNAMAAEVIRREVEYDPSAPGRQEALPVGLSSLGEKWRQEVEGPPSGHRHWAVLYEDAEGGFLGVVGSIDLSPLFAAVTLRGSQLLLTIPRARILGWKKLDGSDSDVLHFATGIQGWGAYLHEGVDYSSREVNGIYWPPRRGPAAQLKISTPKVKPRRR